MHSFRPLQPSDPPEQRALLAAVLEGDFRQFVRYFFRVLHGTPWVNNWHHDEIIDALMACHRHEVKRLLINIPPRYGKTELVVILFGAWCLAKNSRCQFIHLSYSDELALYNSSQIKEIIQMDEFQALWCVEINSNRSAKGLWRTMDGGGVKAGSAGGQVTGFGAGVDDSEFGGAIIIDDPIKPDDAEHENKRAAINKRLNRTIKSRLNSKATPIIMIMQRVTEDDPSGFVLDGGTGEEWTHLKIPAWDENKVPLWEFRHGREELDAIKRADPYTFSGQYLQDPTPEEGGFFKRAWFWRFDPEEMPAVHKYQTADFAVTKAAEGRNPDCTEVGVHGTQQTAEGDTRLFLCIDGFSIQEAPEGWVRPYFDLVLRHKPFCEFAEVGVIRRAVEGMLARIRRNMKAYGQVEWLPHIGDKHANARALQAMARMGLVGIADTEYGDHVLDQLVKFPGTFDDAVDMCALMARAIDEAHPMINAPMVEQKPITDCWGRPIRAKNDWKTL